MKPIDVTKPVMDKIVRFEERRTHAWMRLFRVSIGLLFTLSGVFIWQVWLQLYERQTLDLLTLVREDREIIQEFWQDSALVFIEELPQDTLITAGIFLLAIGIIFWVTRRKRKVIRKKLKELAIHERFSNNTTKEEEFMKNKSLFLIVLVCIVGVVAVVWFRVRGTNMPAVDVSTYTTPVPTTQTDIGSQTSATRETASATKTIPLVVTSPVDGSTVTSASLSVRGTTAPFAEVFINDVEIRADASGDFTVQITLDEGENIIVVIANDADGNLVEKELTITYASS